MDWAKYRTTTFDELIQADGRPRPAARRLVEYLAGLSGRELAERQLAADVVARVQGITFTVYSDGRNVDRTLPFDLIPRIIPLSEWQRTEAGLKQRMRALNLFIGDIYGRQQIVKDKVFPAMLLKDSVNFRAQCVGITPPLGVWAHICGSDLVRDGDGTSSVRGTGSNGSTRQMPPPGRRWPCRAARTLATASSHRFWSPPAAVTWNVAPKVPPVPVSRSSSPGIAAPV